VNLIIIDNGVPPVTCPCWSVITTVVSNVYYLTRPKGRRAATPATLRGAHEIQEQKEKSGWYKDRQRPAGTRICIQYGRENSEASIKLLIHADNRRSHESHGKCTATPRNCSCLPKSDTSLLRPTNKGSGNPQDTALLQRGIFTQH
jgi:hypothetical protein